MSQGPCVGPSQDGAAQVELWSTGGGRPREAGAERPGACGMQACVLALRREPCRRPPHVG